MERGAGTGHWCWHSTTVLAGVVMELCLAPLLSHRLSLSCTGPRSSWGTSSRRRAGGTALPQGPSGTGGCARSLHSRCCAGLGSELRGAAPEPDLVTTQQKCSVLFGHACQLHRAAVIDPKCCFERVRTPAGCPELTVLPRPSHRATRLCTAVPSPAHFPHSHARYLETDDVCSGAACVQQAGN